jgi:hypothetical protein
MRIAVVSDTHGLLRPELPLLLAGADHILHCGDVGKIGILTVLRAIAPVTAIRGNVDTYGECVELPETELVTLGGRDFYLLHDLNALELEPGAAGIACVLSGHSHRPEIRRHRGVLYVNPGSCGPRRFRLPVTCGVITVTGDGELEAEILPLPVAD